MGPRRSVAEMSSACFAFLSTLTLQWGRDRSVAEIRRHVGHPRAVESWLQWGREQICRGNASALSATLGQLKRFNGAAIRSVAEMPAASSRDWPMFGCFNGAATDLLAEIRCGRGSLTERGSFNGAAIRSVAEISGPRTAVRSPHFASMGPRQICRGNGCGRSGNAALSPGFNGAATDCRGNRPRPLSYAASQQLQWGRDRSVVEMTPAPTQDCLALSTWLQWGRDRSDAEMLAAARRPAHPSASMGPRRNCRGNSRRRRLS